MCGIIAIKNLRDKSPVNQAVRIIYENQKDRGQSGFGFVGLSAKNIDTYRSTKEKDILEYLKAKNYDEILFHHRNPTSTENHIETTHPFVIEVGTKRYYFVHNGIINNDWELKAKHLKLGIKYVSENTIGEFNDSEALGWEFCLWLNNKTDKFEAQGSVAFICLETNKKDNRADRLYFYRDSISDLHYFRDKDLLVISSEGHWDKVKANNIYYYDYPTKDVRKFKTLKIDPVEYHFSTKPYWQTDKEWNKIWKRDNNRFTDRLKRNQGSIFNDDIPDFTDSNDEVIMDWIAYIKEQIQLLKEEQTFLITQSYIIDAQTLTEDIIELEEIYEDCRRYLNKPVKTPRERKQLLAQLDVVFGDFQRVG